jgi:Mn2+/Fe2+ NRAMP family transporter
MSTSEPPVVPGETVPAGVLPDWTVGDLPPPPVLSWRNWSAIVGPGVLLAGASIGSGEWLAGPGVTAQYGGTLLWLATLSIVAQVFANIEFMRYTIYCGEPLLVGAFRTWPGPLVWVVVYALMELAHVWPFNVANAAVALVSAIVGRLLEQEHQGLVTTLGIVLFLLSFVPLIFGGTAYKTLERIMSAKLVFVLVFLGLVSCFLVSGTTAYDVLTGFVRFGQVPVRADTIIDGRHFMVAQYDGSTRYGVQGTVGPDGAVVTGWKVDDKSFTDLQNPILAPHKTKLEMLKSWAEERAQPDRFLVADVRQFGSVSAAGKINADGSWGSPEITVADADGTQVYERVADLPDDEMRTRVVELINNRGLERVSALRYLRQHGQLPELDWALVAAFASIAGAGGLTNVMLSNYARDKGYGMGARVGAIPSAVGGTTVKLSHVGKVFPLTPENQLRWKGWMRHIVREQVGLWMICCFIGMALPCMMSVEFIRNAPVSEIRVAAMTAEGIDHRHPGWGLWPLTLFVAFLILYPGQILAGDIVPRRWCDIIWVASPLARRVRETRVKYIYYSLMIGMAIFGLVALLNVKPITLLKISGFVLNISLGASALHALYVNCTLLPPPLRPNWFMRLGVLSCGLFFFVISGIALFTVL